MKGAYDPGVVTCVPYAVVGGLLVAAVPRASSRDMLRPSSRRGVPYETRDLPR